MKAKPKSTTLVKPDSGDETACAEVLGLIEQAKRRAFQAVNTELIELYWRVGEYISRKIVAAEWGEGVVDRLAEHIRKRDPNLRGFTRPDLFRMRQFYETYAGDEKVSALLRQLPWTHNLIVLGQSKRPEEREFYLRMAIRERWSSRDLERQIKTALFERAVLNPPKVSAVVTQLHSDAVSIFKDSYVVEFLNLPDGHSEADLHSGLLRQLKDFMIELGRDFCFVGSEYPVQVGGRDFALDLLFFHRGINSLVAIELKIGRFEPEYRAEVKAQLSIALPDEDGKVEPIPGGGGGGKREPELDLLSNIVKQFNELWGDVPWQDKDKVRKIISEELPAKVAADRAYQNAQEHSDKNAARIEHDRALRDSILAFLADQTELFKQFQDNESFRKWLCDSIFAATYQKAAG